MTMQSIRDNYGVPAKRGGRVEFTGNGMSVMGTLTGSKGALLRIRLDVNRHSSLFHPTWELRYLTESTP